MTSDLAYALRESLHTPEARRDPDAVVRTWAVTLQALGYRADSILDALETVISSEHLLISRAVRFRLCLMVQSLVGGF